MRKKWYHGFVLLIIFIGTAGILLLIGKKHIDARTRLMFREVPPKLFKERVRNPQTLLIDRLQTAEQQYDYMPYVSIEEFSTDSVNLSTFDKQSNSVTLLLSGGELGYLYPCGCSEGQVGGISRRDTLLTRMREQSESVIAIANGNLMLDASRQSEIKADIGFFALTDMGYIAYNVGQYDLQLGIMQLTSLSEQNKLPLLSANLYRGTSPVFEPYILHTVDLSEDKMTVAVIGLISPNYTIYAQNLDLKIIEPKTVLESLLSKLIKDADVIVCLFNGSTDEAATLKSKFPMLDVVVLSNEKTDNITKSPHPHPLVNTGVKGKAVYAVKINRDTTGKLIVKKPIRYLLHEKIHDSPRMTQLLELYQEMIVAEDLLESPSQKQQKTTPQFVGTTACKTCHIDIWKSWKETKHAHAYHTLEVAGHETDPECLTCHTVGFGDSTGFISVEKTPHHIDVGCENCHGAGSIHAKFPERKGYGILKEKLCVTCHTPENSPKFDIKIYFPKIVHSDKESPIIKENSH